MVEAAQHHVESPPHERSFLAGFVWKADVDDEAVRRRVSRGVSAVGEV